MDIMKYGDYEIIDWLDNDIMRYEILRYEILRY